MKFSLPRLGGLLLVASLFFHSPARAEDDCAGPFYQESTCAGNCPQDKCHDQSVDQNGSEFQCCPPSAATPELPEGFGPFALALVFLTFLFLRKRMRKAKVTTSGPPAG
jgi:hypothetical protein